MGRWDELDGIEEEYIPMPSYVLSEKIQPKKPDSIAPMIGLICFVIAGFIYFGAQGHSVALPTMPTVSSSAQVSSHTTGTTTGKGGIYGQMARDAANSVGIPPEYFVNQMYDESGLNPNVPNGTSGEIGIAQIMPSTAAGLGINPADPHSALYGAAGIMSRHFQHYGDYAKALAAYNCGRGCVDSAVNRCGGSWVNCIPSITKAYIRNAMG